MSSWGKTDAEASAPLWAAAYVNAAPNTTNRGNLFNNTTPNNFISGVTVGLFNYTAGEVPSGAHRGWVLKTTGSGGRTGRVRSETIVTLSSNS